MQIKLFKTLWGFDGDYVNAVRQAVADGYDGVEGPIPQDEVTRERFADALARHRMDYIQEICTAGGYVPERHVSPVQHLEDLEQALQLGQPLKPLFVTSLAGCDAWPEQQSIDFFDRAMKLAEQHNTTLCFETHRGRSTYNPWTTLRIVEALPQIKLTADFSHWCVVCERLVDTELELIQTIAANIHHIHARVGYDQGPQVPHPAAPEYYQALAAHQSWWQLIWQSQQMRNYSLTTMTPEFGPDGYLHHTPFNNAPVADLAQINRWMMTTEREHFGCFVKENSFKQA